jgi:hypothetical protein
VKIDVQLKATSGDALDTDDVIFDLDVATYDALRSLQTQSAQLLVVLVLPESSNDWLTADEQSLILKKCAYWIHLAGAQATQNARTTRVRLPRSQIFGPEALRDLIARADEKARLGETGI